MNDYQKPIKPFQALPQHFSDEISPTFQHDHLILKGGHVVDPKNQIDEVQDIRVEKGPIAAISQSIRELPEDHVINCKGLLVFPGLIDMHLHLGDLFDIFESPIFKAAKDGVTMGLSPGAGNTFMAPALIGAEVDRGIPINAGVYLGAASILSTCMSVSELIAMLQKSLDPEIISQKLTRNAITNATAHLTVGIKDHMGHFIMTDENIDRIFEITSRAGLLYMSHTQDPEHARRMAKISCGRPLHLAHATAAGCGTHGEPVKSLRDVLSLIDNEVITGEFVTSMLLSNRGRYDGLKIDPKAQELAFQALQDGKVDILISDGQSGSTMKGFGNTEDNLPGLFALVEKGVLPLSKAVATMTCNPARLLSKRLNNPIFKDKIGHLGIGAHANITIADPDSQKAIHTIVNGIPTAFDGSLIREGFGAGCLVNKTGVLQRTGVGDLTLYSR